MNTGFSPSGSVRWNLRRMNGGYKGTVSVLTRRGVFAQLNGLEGQFARRPRYFYTEERGGRDPQAHRRRRQRRGKLSGYGPTCLTCEGVGMSKAAAMNAAVDLARQMMDNPMVRALLPPQATIAIKAMSKISRMVKGGGARRFLGKMFKRIKSGGLRGFAKALFG